MLEDLLSEQAPKYVMHEVNGVSQLCRVVESWEPVDIAQVSAGVDADAERLATAKAELDEHDRLRQDKANRVEELEAVLEDSKRGLAVARTVMGEADDAESTDGVDGEVANTEAEPTPNW